MRTVSALVLCMMVVATFASHHKNHQAKLQKELLTDKLKKSNFGRAILQMVELNA